MYVVFSNEGLSYLGDCQTQALAVFGSKPNTTLHTVANLNELQELMPEGDQKHVVSEAFKNLTQKLDELGVNEDLADKVRENGKKLVGEVKSLGVRGMKAVGEGFVALGELLRKAGVDECDQNTCCNKE